MRSVQPEVVALLRDGIARSATFDALVAALNGSDVVAYVESTLKMRSGLDGYLAQSVIVAGERRYIHIFVNAGLGRDRLIGIIGHELQHAVEAAQALDTRSDDAVRSLFRSLDSGRCVRHCTETDEAVRTQEAISRELRNGSSSKSERGKG